MAIVQQIKESCSFVSEKFHHDMQVASQRDGPLHREFVLPDYKTVKKGYVKTPESVIEPDQQVIKLATERFTVPEVIFSPNDIGIN
jgi:actin-related protein 6